MVFKSSVQHKSSTSPCRKIKMTTFDLGPGFWFGDLRSVICDLWSAKMSMTPILHWKKLTPNKHAAQLRMWYLNVHSLPQESASSPAYGADVLRWWVARAGLDTLVEISLEQLDTARACEVHKVSYKTPNMIIKQLQRKKLGICLITVKTHYNSHRKTPCKGNGILSI